MRGRVKITRRPTGNQRQGENMREDRRGREAGLEAGIAPGIDGKVEAHLSDGLTG